MDNTRKSTGAIRAGRGAGALLHRPAGNCPVLLESATFPCYNKFAFVCTTFSREE